MAHLLSIRATKVSKTESSVDGEGTTTASLIFGFCKSELTAEGEDTAVTSPVFTVSMAVVNGEGAK